MRAKQQGTFDLTAPMPKLSEDDVKTQKILMQEMIEQGPDPEQEARLELYRSHMRLQRYDERLREAKGEAKGLNNHDNRRDDQ
jgi:hypothetical protein